jgi:hypothetical protein
MKGRPFYVLSAAAMLAGCHLLSRALAIEASQLTGLLILMGVLQAYEWLLVGLGTRLLTRDVSSSDGAALLALETFFLLDATLLATDGEGRNLAGLAFVTSGLGLLLVVPVLGVDTTHISAHESAAIRDVRTVLAAQEDYRQANEGFYDARLECVARPTRCLPSYPEKGAPMLDESLSSITVRGGYVWALHAGPAPEPRSAQTSPTSVRAFAYTAVPAAPGRTGVRGFCGDSTGFVCFTPDGRLPAVAADGSCVRTGCVGLQ